MTVVMIGPAIDEVVATLSFLFRARSEGQSLWHTFWRGGAVAVRRLDVGPRAEQSLLRQLAGGLEILSIPWNLAVAAALGLWIMTAPAVLENVGASANSDHMVGALIVTFSVIGFSESGRAARLVLVPLGLWLFGSSYLIDGSTSLSYWNDMAVGLAIIALSIRRGRITEDYGAWNRWVF
jgi:hypothetical protein